MAAEVPGGQLRDVRTSQEFRAYARGRLIESRLTPNAISLTGFVLNVVAAVLVTQRLWVLAGLAFIVGSVMDTLDGRYSRMSGKGTPFGAFLEGTGGWMVPMLERFDHQAALPCVIERRRHVLCDATAAGSEPGTDRRRAFGRRV